MDKQFNRKLIAPLVVIGLAIVTKLTGVEFEDVDVDNVTFAIATLAGVAAAFIKPKK